MQSFSLFLAHKFVLFQKKTPSPLAWTEVQPSVYQFNFGPFRPKTLDERLRPTLLPADDLRRPLPISETITNIPLPIYH